MGCPHQAKKKNRTRDHNLSPEDLQLLKSWEQQWDMAYHSGKCTTLPVTKKRNSPKSDYILHGHTLKTVQESKVLDVTMTKDLRKAYP